MTSKDEAPVMTKEAMIMRLKRINGQVAAITRMLGEERPTQQVRQQVNAARNALDAISKALD